MSADWIVTLLGLLALVTLTGIGLAVYRRGWERGYALGRADGEALFDTEETPSPGHTLADEDEPDPRPSRRSPARVRTAQVRNPWQPADDYEHPEEDADPR